MTSAPPSELCAPYLPSLERARADGLRLPAPLPLRLRGVGNLLRAEPVARWALGAVQTLGERTRRRRGEIAREVHDQTHVGGRLASLELELRQAVVAFARHGEWPAALRMSLDPVSSAGAYREAPVEERRSFAGFDCDEACALARAARDEFLGVPEIVQAACEAYAIPVLLLAFRGLGWHRTVALVALTGRVELVVPWAQA